MNDAFTSSDDAFTADEEAAWGAMSGGEAAPEPAGGELPAPGGEAAPVAPAAPAAPAGEAAPGEVVEPDADDVDADQNKGKFVRHGAFHQERERRKAVERERDEMRVSFARMEERLRILSEAPKAPAAQAPQAPAAPVAPPDPNEDIFGAYAHLQAELAALKTGQTQLTEAQQAERAAVAEREEHGRAMDTYRTDAQRFIAAEPAFVDAYNHLITSRVAELKLYGMDEGAAMKAVADDEAGLVKAALAAGRSPAEHIFQVAKARGFQPKAPEPAPAPAAPAETAAERSARIAKGQAASVSLSAAGGAPAGEITLEMLASMSEADFAKMEKANPARVRALMGG